jgi:hypothetical protein
MVCSMCYSDRLLPTNMYACEMIAPLHDEYVVDARIDVQRLRAGESVENEERQPNDHIICIDCLRQHCNAQCEQGLSAYANVSLTV